MRFAKPLFCVVRTLLRISLLCERHTSVARSLLSAFHTGNVKDIAFMTETLNVVLIASVAAACTATISGALQEYFHYVHSLVWIAVVRSLNIYSVEFHQSKVNERAGSIFDLLQQDSHCRAFTWKASSWADGSQHHYIFLPTPTWKACVLQALMLGYYVYLPSDNKKPLRMLVPKEAVDALLAAANFLDRNELIPEEFLEALRATFHTDGSSKSIIDQFFLCKRWC